MRIPCCRLQVLGLQRARDGVEAEMKGLVLARHTAESTGAAARGRVAGLEAACEAHAFQIEMLTAHLTAARHSKVRRTTYTLRSKS